MKQGFLSVLKNRDFSKIWLAQIFSQTANHFLNFLLVLKVFELTGSNASVSILIICFTVPAVFVGIYAGVVADRFSQKTIMLMTNVLRTLFVFGLIFSSSTLIFIYFFAFLISTVMQFFIPAEAARIPAVVSRQEYIFANSLYVFTNYATIIIGYSLVGFRYFLSEDQQFLLISSLFLIASFMILLLPRDNVSKREVSFDIFFKGIVKDFYEGWRVIKTNRSVLIPMLYLITIWIAFGASYVMIPPLTKEILHLPLEAASYMVIVPVGVGTLVAALFVEKIAKRINKHRLISLGIFLIGISALFVSFLPDLSEMAHSDLSSFIKYLSFLKDPFILFLFFLIGFGALSVVVSAQTILQENTEEDMRGRIWGVLSMVTNVINFLPVLIIGVLADIFPIQIIIMFLALLVISWALINFVFGFCSANKKPRF